MREELAGIELIMSERMVKAAKRKLGRQKVRQKVQAGTNADGNVIEVAKKRRLSKAEARSWSSQSEREVSVQDKLSSIALRPRPYKY
jgi:hypothetical protein